MKVVKTFGNKRERERGEGMKKRSRDRRRKREREINGNSIAQSTLRSSQRYRLTPYPGIIFL